MAGKRKKKSTHINAEGYAYLTKRVLISASRKAAKKASDEAYQLQGYNLVEEDGWVVKIWSDGQRQRLCKTPFINIQRPSTFILD